MDDSNPARDIPPDLLQRICNRDPAALAEYFDLKRSQLAGFVRVITGDHLLAIVEVDDLLQEIATTALQSLQTAPLDRYEPMEWLQQIARRRVVDAHRFHFDAKCRDANRQKSLQGGASSNVSQLNFEGLLAASMTSPSAVISRDIRMVRVREALSGLTDEQQTVIRLRYAEGLPSRTIAESINKSDAATRVLLSRSMRQLEKRLADVRPTR
jgi:RNA polymerase sigma-70 factor (ECF subfamily)|tara:strand:- start:552 stop:1187 length:636 start_codon:yes stop_codon:yes gene_type:complete